MKTKSVVKLNENSIKKIVKECVKRYIKEDIANNPIQNNVNETDEVTKMIPYLASCAEYIDKLGLVALGSAKNEDAKESIERLISRAESQLRIALEEVGVDLYDYYDDSKYSNQYGEMFRDEDDESFL